ncbi:MAG: aldose epimerase family protein [Chryseosolibacter sp.]
MKRNSRNGLLFSCALALFGCSVKTSEQAPTREAKTGAITRELFGTMPDGGEVHLYTISNAKGLTIKATNYGGIITSIITPDKNGKEGDVVLGFDSLRRYLDRHPHMGPLIGRYSGYVAGGKFSIGNADYQLTINSGGNHLHGGIKAFDKALWTATEVETAEGPGVQLSYTSPDGEEGYPGTLKTTVTYVVTDDNSLQITYEAETDQQTHVNLTNHLYFNLSGLQAEDIMQHELKINATEFAVPGKGNIPTGELKRVEGTPLDFRDPMVIGSRIEALPNKGYDHNYVLKPDNDTELILAATVHDPVSGRIMEVYTTHTGLEFASANWLKVRGKGGANYGRSAGFLLYPQHLPDSPNRPDFPSTLLQPGERYHEKTVYKFSIKS